MEGNEVLLSTSRSFEELPMSFIAALDNIAMVCEVLNLPPAVPLAPAKWQLNVDECPLEIAFSESKNELQITYELLGGLTSHVPLDTVKRWAHFSELHLRNDVGSAVLCPEKHALLLVGSIGLGDGDACALSLRLPLFLTACSAWRKGFVEGVGGEHLIPLVSAKAKRNLRHLALVTAKTSP